MIIWKHTQKHCFTDGSSLTKNCTEKSPKMLKQYQGLPLDQIAYFEKCFEVNVNIFQLRDDGVALTVYKSRCHHKDTMNLNIYEHHLSYITNLPTYTQKYKCGSCDRHFQYLRSMKRRQLNCKGQSTSSAVGFIPIPKPYLKEQGINISAVDRLFKWFIVYDFESMLVPIHESNSEKLTWIQEHVPISVSVCSNVDGYRHPHCIVQPEIELLVRDMVSYMTDSE